MVFQNSADLTNILLDILTQTYTLFIEECVKKIVVCKVYVTVYKQNINYVCFVLLCCNPSVAIIINKLPGVVV